MPVESLKSKRQRAGEINKLLTREYPQAVTALRHKNPLELLVATILSAQCTDRRVNEVTRLLFKKYQSIADYLSADPQELENDIRPTGFFRNKTKSIQGCCRGLAEQHQGQVPQTMDELVQLPGIGRKTANVVLGSAYGIAVGVVVDTHVARLAGRMKLSSAEGPVKIEADLMKILPQREWIGFAHRLIFHGRALCRARKALCAPCPVNRLCPSSTA